MASKDRQRFVGFYMYFDMHSALVKLATHQGRDVSELILEFIDKGLQQLADYAEVDNQYLPHEVKVYVQYHKLQIEQSTRFQLRTIARSVLSTGDEKLADRLEELCRGAHISVDEIMTEAKTEEQAATFVASMDYGTGDTLQQAVAWILGALKNGQTISST